MTITHYDRNGILSYLSERCGTLGSSDCFVWQLKVNQDGYGRARYKDKLIMAHRLAYIAEHGELPEGTEIDHLCRNRACCNPAHMEAVPHRINILRGESPAAKHATQTHCKRGHPFTPENTGIQVYKGKSRRYCKVCTRCLNAAWRENHKEELAEYARVKSAKWYQDHKQLVFERSKAWRLQHRGEINARRRQQRAFKKELSA